MTGGGADSHPMEALALVADLLAENKLVIKVETFPFEHAAAAYRLSQGGQCPRQTRHGPLTRLTAPSPGNACRIIECSIVLQPRL